MSLISQPRKELAVRDISNNDNVIDIRDVIERIEELHAIAIDETADRNDRNDADNELAVLQALLDKCCGKGGDHQWHGDWYPVTLFRDNYFRAYAEQLAEAIGAINAGAAWPNNCIDWGQAARELQMDYTSVDFDGVTYWVR